MKKRIAVLTLTLALFAAFSLVWAVPAGAANGGVIMNVTLQQGNYQRTSPAAGWVQGDSYYILLRDLCLITGSSFLWYEDDGSVSLTNHHGYSLFNPKIKAIYQGLASPSPAQSSAAGEQEEVPEGSPGPELVLLDPPDPLAETLEEEVREGEGEIETGDGPLTVPAPEITAESGQNQPPPGSGATWTYQKIAKNDAILQRDGATYLPLSYLDALGYIPSWDGATNALTLGVPTGVYCREAPKELVDQARAALKKDIPQEKEKLLSTYSTKFKTSQYNRSINLRLATKAINGTLVQPGATFSFNKTVGPRTAARGYKSAIIYAQGKQVYGLGGGICQVSSTLYNAVLGAKLQVVERWAHSLPVTYVPKGRDATVSWGSADFRFKNNTNRPVKIVAATDGGTLTVSLYAQ